MIESAKLDRLLARVICHITSIGRLRRAGAISERKAEQELKQAVELVVPQRLSTPRRAAWATASVRPTASSLSSNEPTWNLAV
jgi:hypothetical protein